MRTAGIDLAAEPRGTALAVITWGRSAAALTELSTGLDDDTLADVAVEVDSVGIDCALGWPDEFLAFVAAHARGDRLDRGTAGAGPAEGMAWRRRLAYRETDRVVRAETGRWPLSVSTDRLGLTAMRCAALLDTLDRRGLDVDRSGAGRVAEVYPAATLRRWGLDTRGYKIDSARRAALLDDLRRRAPWLDLGAHDVLLAANDDAFDSLIACLATRAHALGRSLPVPDELRAQARREGWVALPTCPLEDLDPSR